MNRRTPIAQIVEQLQFLTLSTRIDKDFPAIGPSQLKPKNLSNNASVAGHFGQEHGLAARGATNGCLQNAPAHTLNARCQEPPKVGGGRTTGKSFTALLLKTV